MDATIIAILIVCITAVLIAGCTTGSAPPGSATSTPPSSLTPGVTAAPADSLGCILDEDCVPAQCCNSTSCINKAAAPSCNNVMRMMSCEGLIDCGAGSCGCMNGECGIVAPGDQVAHETSVKLEASPQRYSPMMSSTPGIGLTPNVTGFKATDATFEWNATFGRFFMWDAPDYKVHDIGNPVATDGRTIYWTFTEKPVSINEPVTITVTARDTTRRGAVLGTSTVTLRWDGDYAVYVGEIQ
jgi:hypothetical protein